MNMDGTEFLKKFFQSLNDCPNFSSKYGCWVRQSHGNYGVWWKNCNTSHNIFIPWTICINWNVITAPVTVPDKQMYLCDLSSDTPYPAQSSVVWYTKMVKQNMKVFPICVKKPMLEAIKNCLMRRPKVRIAFGLASNNFIYFLSNTASCVECLGSDLILEAYCRDSFSPQKRVCASTFKLYSADILNAPRQRPWLCTEPSICKYDFRTDPYTMHP